jgi:hypothetical protein
LNFQAEKWRLGLVVPVPEAGIDDIAEDGSEAVAQADIE